MSGSRAIERERNSEHKTVYSQERTQYIVQQRSPDFNCFSKSTVRTMLLLLRSVAIAAWCVGSASPLELSRPKLVKNIKTPDPIPADGIAGALKCMESGSLFRYNVASADESQVSLAEQEFAAYTGHKFALGLNSCGSAIFLSMVCAGARPGDRVLTNGFTFTAVPSAIVHAGCEPLYVECTPGLVVDIVDLERKMKENRDAKFFMVSHMRGKLAEMDKISELCEKYGVTLIEDSAHALGVLWNGEHSGHHGVAASYSSQSYKMLNSGEGGFLVTDDDEIIAQAMAYAGAYEVLSKKHKCVPSKESLARHMDGSIPNYSLRMHEATAAMIRPQLRTVEERREKYNERYYRIADRLGSVDGVTVPQQLHQVTIVGDSIQFSIDPEFFGSEPQGGVDDFIARCAERGLPVEQFGGKTNARNFENWRYAPQPLCGLPRTKEIISYTFDVRLPLLFEEADFDVILTILEESVAETKLGFANIHIQYPSVVAPIGANSTNLVGV